MDRETWEAMTVEERKAWKKRKERMEYIVFSILIPILIAVVSTLIFYPWFLGLLLHQ